MQRLLFNIKKHERSLTRFQFLYGDINNVKTLSDIDNLPVTSKHALRSCLRHIPFKKSEGPNIKICHTSGTTGAGLIFPVPVSADVRQWALWWRFRQSHDIQIDDCCGYFGGRSIVPASEKNRFYRFNAHARQIMFSAYHLTDRNLNSYIEGINKYGAKWLHGYPSVLSEFARLLEKNGLENSVEINIVSTGAESLLMYQREIIERVLKCKVIEHYGLAEATVNISQNGDGFLVVDEDYSLVELYPDEKTENSYKIIGTSLDNYVLPIIRYDSGDVCSLGECKFDERLWRKVDAIDGRIEDFVTLSDGTKVGRLDHIFKDIVYVRQAQLVQSEIGKCLVYIVADGDLDKCQLSEIRDSFYERLGDRLDINIRVVPEIHKTNSGKHRFVISRL